MLLYIAGEGTLIAAIEYFSDASNSRIGEKEKGGKKETEKKRGVGNWSGSGEKFVFDNVVRELDVIAKVQFFEDARTVRRDGFFAERKLLGDFFE